MKKSKLQKLVSSVKCFLNGECSKKIRDKEALIDSLKKLKKQEIKLKQKIANAQAKELKKLTQELEVLKKLRKKANILLKDIEKQLFVIN